VSEEKKLEVLRQELNKAQSDWKSYNCNKSGHLMTLPVPRLRWKIHYSQWGEERVLEQASSCLYCSEITWVPVEGVES